MKKKVDLLIKGDLIADRITAYSIIIDGGGVSDIICDKNIDNYDILKAIVIEGDVCVKSLISPLYVLVTGNIVAKGGYYVSE